jgi:trimeric autotransporter adhesin
MKKNTFRIFLFCSLFFLVKSNTIFAQAPQQFNYQAIARNSVGQAIANASIKARISILDGSGTAASVYSETRNVTTNQLGLFTIAIGSTGAASTTGVFTNIDWSTGKKFIKVEVDPLGGNNLVVLGSTELLSVPYALYAVNGKIGPAGPQGQQGNTGATGATGAQGTQGLVGATGAQGQIGLTGATGVQGTQGLVGATGAQGLQGNTGATGATGAQGPQGLTGATGAQGSIGLTGATGATGAQGSQGLTGATGAQGSIGLTGATGATGAQGIQGLTVATGAQGLQGLQGIAGTNGSNGTNGTNGNNSLIKTTTELVGANCATGGVKQEYGIDVNGNGTLEASEINAALTKFVCNGAAGSAANAWALTGNAATTTANFIGTTDAQDVRFKVNNQPFGLLGNASKNIFFGENAGAATTGTNNVAMGSGALNKNTFQSESVAVGDSSLYNNGLNVISGGWATYNTAVGAKTLITNDSGYYNVAVGHWALYSNKSGYWNTAIGGGAMVSNKTGANNVAVGAQSLVNNTTGANNVAIGRTALANNLTGIQNIAIGRSALFANTTGSGNVAIGRVALANSVDRSGLVAIGDSALYNNYLGATLAEHSTGNTAVGSKTLFANTTGFYNTATGSNALMSNTTGIGNTANGTGALVFNTTGSGNTVMGLNAIFAGTGDNNTAIGAEAINNLVTGNGNTGIGRRALNLNNTGNNNTALGSGADVTAGNLTNATAIGYNAKVAASNSLVLGGTGVDAVNVGIGTTTPNAPLQFANNIANRKIVLWDNGNNDHQYYGFGVNSGTLRYQVSAAVENHIFYAGASPTTSNELMRIQGNGDVGIGKSGAAFAYGHGGTNRILELRNAAPAGGDIQSHLVLSSTGNAGSMGGVTWASTSLTGEQRTGYIGTAFETPTADQTRISFYTRSNTGILAERFYIQGNGNAWLQGTLTQNSDIRLKKNIVPLTLSLNKLTQLNGYTYNWISKDKDPNEQIGLIAQEVQKLYPQLVSDIKGENGETTLGVNYTGLIPVMIESIKEQQKQIDELKLLVQKLLNK